MEEIKFNNNLIKYKIIRSNRKTLAIIVDPEDGVVIRAPKHLSKSKIRELLKKKGNWILKKKEKVSEIKPKTAPKKFITGESFLYLGESYKLRLIKDISKEIAIDLSQGSLQIKVNPKINLNNKELIKDKLVDWYKDQAIKILMERIERYKVIIGKEPNKLRVKNHKKRWGSCSSLGNLNFNWKIVMAPIEIVDYLVVHELAHLVQPNHSPNFWSLVENIIPDYKARKEWLRINANTLNI
ncbi:M48 family metallopeptidase [Orenia marismortui]|uniref:YgjP-like metallopeptidase domain-containing protein n=1 Tax=Orenia marismortui TaxID=46469 RepID=A0A4R8GTQ7_9FIRM|nr:SprT family zinc-dependent metalloprotease [Orenia marismortui]TDX48218.1 hypothetical protein C7959_13213 [Orenia marismortui]